MTNVVCQVIEFYRFYKLVLLQPINPLNQTFLLSALSFAFPHLATRIPPTALYYFNRISG